MKTFSSERLPPGRTVRVGGREIWVAEIGSAPPLLMLRQRPRCGGSREFRTQS